jgi:hypothetical protein
MLNIALIRGGHLPGPIKIYLQRRLRSETQEVSRMPILGTSTNRFRT